MEEDDWLYRPLKKEAEKKKTSRNEVSEHCCQLTETAHLFVKVSGPPRSLSLSAVPLLRPLPLLQKPLVLCGFFNVLLP